MPNIRNMEDLRAIYANRMLTLQGQLDNIPYVDEQDEPLKAALLSMHRLGLASQIDALQRDIDFIEERCRKHRKGIAQR